MTVRLLTGPERAAAFATVEAKHYAHSVPSGKTYAFAVDAALVLISIPANKNVARFLGVSRVWELSRLWAPDGHEKNLLTRAISESVTEFRKLEPTVEGLVSYADPNVGHSGGVYRAASWIFHGQSEEGRYYVDASGQSISRRAFHSGGRSMKKAEILSRGFREERRPGKLRFIFPLDRRTRKLWTRGEAK